MLTGHHDPDGGRSSEREYAGSHRGQEDTAATETVETARLHTGFVSCRA
jgi:hypothetical protein